MLQKLLKHSQYYGDKFIKCLPVHLRNQFLLELQCIRVLQKLLWRRRGGEDQPAERVLVHLQKVVLLQPNQVLPELQSICGQVCQQLRWPFGKCRRVQVRRWFLLESQAGRPSLRAKLHQGEGPLRFWTQRIQLRHMQL